MNHFYCEIFFSPKRPFL